MKNNSSEEAHIIWIIKEDSVNVSPLFMSNATEVKFILQPIRPHNEAKVLYGTGSWNSLLLKELADDLVSLTIVHRMDSVKLSTEEEISNYLLERRGGFGKSRISIVIQ